MLGSAKTVQVCPSRINVRRGSLQWQDEMIRNARSLQLVNFAILPVRVVIVDLFMTLRRNGGAESLLTRIPMSPEQDHLYRPRDATMERCRLSH